MNRSKGQYRIISEIILFAVGILITSYVIVNFNSLQSATQEITLDDQMNNIADIVATAIVKVSTQDNATVRLTIPDRISDSIYRISIKDAGGGKIIVSKMDGTASVERQIFNINYNNTINTGSVINNSEVVSSAQFIEIVKNEKITILRR
ncbi:MAG: hypothetical protein HY517_00940 [Candidatus Aenigmarchaeota archaeon]|nr:hypothetical protein [Candidatus Aenigmarchaeota archaeon]